MLGRQRPRVALLNGPQHLCLALWPIKDGRRLVRLRRIELHLRDLLRAPSSLADQLEQLTVDGVNALANLAELFIRVHGVSPRRVS